MLQPPCAGLRAQWVSYEPQYLLFSPGARPVKTGLMVSCGRWAPGTATSGALSQVSPPFLK